MQVKKLHEKQGIKPAAKYPCAEAGITALETQLRINYQPKEDDVMKIEGETPKEQAWRRNREILVVTPCVVWQAQETPLAPRVIEKGCQHKLC